MRTSFVFVSLVASLAWAQPRCDGANTKDLKCADVPEIMALETSECQPYHILISRGTDERPPGRMGNITKLVCDSVGGKDKCGWENVDYPAKNRFISETTWCDSADIGARNGQKQMADYVKKCPDTKLVLLGYSQGGSITQDFMGGGGGPIFKCTQVDNPPLNRKSSPGKNGMQPGEIEKWIQLMFLSCCGRHLRYRKTRFQSELFCRVWQGLQERGTAKRSATQSPPTVCRCDPGLLPHGRSYLRNQQRKP